MIEDLFDEPECDLDTLLEEDSAVFRALRREDAQRAEHRRDGMSIDTAEDYRDYILSNLC